MLLAPPAALAGPPPESSERVYLALGNSLAVGVGATRGDVVGYVPRLAQFLRSEARGGVRELVNLAKGGTTSATPGASGTRASCSTIASSSARVAG